MHAARGCKVEEPAEGQLGNGDTAGAQPLGMCGMAHQHALVLPGALHGERKADEEFLGPAMPRPAHRLQEPHHSRSSRALR